MTRWLRATVAFFVLASLSPLIAAAQTPPAAASPLRTLLALVPDSDALRMDEYSLITYVDFRAGERIAQLEPFRTAADYEAASEEERDWWVAAMSRTSYFSFANTLLAGLSRLPELAGFEWFDVTQIVEFGFPPRQVTIYGGAFDADRIGAALGGRGFALEERDGAPVWWRFEDYGHSLEAREPGEPFGGELGAAARVAILPQGLAYARSWDAIQPVIETQNGARFSLLDTHDFGILVEAIDDPDLIAAVIFPTAAALSLAYPPGQALSGPASTPEPTATPDPNDWLPPYSLAAFADRQDGPDQVNTIALVYPDAGTAQQAGEVLTARLRAGGGVSQMTGADMREFFSEQGVTFDAPRVYSNDSGMAVALVAARYPLKLRQTTDEGRLIWPGLVLRRWMQMVYARDLGWLVVER